MGVWNTWVKYTEYRYYISISYLFCFSFPFYGKYLVILLKCYYDQKKQFFFSLNFKTMLTKD